MWRTLERSESLRSPDRDIAITNIETMGVKGNPKPSGGHYTWGFVKVETDAGVSGFGETYRGHAGMDLVHRMAPRIRGENPLDPHRLASLLAAEYTGGGTVAMTAITAIETACWDIKGKIHEVPIYELLGGKFRDRIEVYSDTDAIARAATDTEEHTPEAVAEAARAVVDQGFRTIKFDLDVPTPGHPPENTAARRLDPVEIEHKVAMVRAAREEIGPEIDLGMDLHWKFSVETAIRLGRMLEPFDLAFLEDPVHPGKLEAQRRVRAAIDIPILTGENVVGMNGFLDLLSNNVVDIAAPDMARCGGLTDFLKIASICDAHGVVMAPHNLTSPLGTIASVHACASIPNAYSVEYRGGDAPWWNELVSVDGYPESILQDGHIPVPDAPGLGVRLNESVVTEHLADGESYFE